MKHEDIFIPENYLEERLLDIYSGKTPLISFIPTLIQSEIFVLVKNAIDFTKPNLNVDPLILKGINEKTVIATFTSLKRTNKIIELYPEYKHRFVIKFNWFIKGVTPDTGIAINPGYTKGLEINYLTIQKIVKDFKIK